MSRTSQQEIGPVITHGGFRLREKTIRVCNYVHHARLYVRDVRVRSRRKLGTFVMLGYVFIVQYVHLRLYVYYGSP